MSPHPPFSSEKAHYFRSKQKETILLSCYLQRLRSTHLLKLTSSYEGSGTLRTTIYSRLQPTTSPRLSGKTTIATFFRHLQIFQSLHFGSFCGRYDSPR